MNDNLHRILIKGGVTSPGELKDSIAMLEAGGLKEVHFGSRQDLLFPLQSAKEEQLEEISRFNTDIVADRSFQNIVSSYVSADIFDMTYWLKGSTYLYILEGFDYLPKLKINITDPKQRLCRSLAVILILLLRKARIIGIYTLNCPIGRRVRIIPFWYIAGIS